MRYGRGGPAEDRLVAVEVLAFAGRAGAAVGDVDRDMLASGPRRPRASTTRQNSAERVTIAVKGRAGPRRFRCG